MERKAAQIFANCPWEGSVSNQAQTKNNDVIVNRPETIKEGVGAVTAFEQTKDGQPKAFIPNFFYKAPFGYPRYKDLFYYRQLAASIYVDMAETAIIDEVCSIDWGIVAEDEDGNELPGKEKEKEVVRAFFNNPNSNPESWEEVIRMMLPDLLELNSGILVKVFNRFGKMVEVVARDGIAFTKNPDMHGFYTDRADLILVKNISADERQTENLGAFPLYQDFITPDQARNEAAYFQYGWNAATRPVPFGRREIIWFDKKVRTDSLYGRSSMEVLANTVQTLVYAVEHNLEYFSDNSIPAGVLGLDGMKTEDIKAFASQWIESQRKQDTLGNWKKEFHKLPMVNKMPKFERLGFTNAELELIESQKWWSKMVWAAFGITATELGFTEDSKGSANQIVQSSIAKKRIIYPLLRLIEYRINTQLIPEFGFTGIKFKYKIFDVDEETKKWNLYKLQTEAGLRSINEVRSAEGLDDLEWGDQAPNAWNANQGMNLNFGDSRQQDADKFNRDAQNQRDQMSGKNPKNPEKPKDPKEEKKAMDTDTSLTLQPGEEMGPKKLKKSILDLLRNNKKKIMEILDSQNTKDPILQIKSIEDLPDMIKKVFAFFGLKSVSDLVIKMEFLKGWDDSEKQLNQNIMFNQKALDFLQDHTFDNIKSMTEDIANKLKAELERGIINGEGTAKLKARVESVFDVGENRADMIARTETNRAENNGKLLAIKGSGLEYEKKWVSAMDERTSDVCKHLDGQTVGINEEFNHGKWSGQSPPAHVDCRSTMIFIEKEDIEKKEALEKEMVLKQQMKEQNELVDRKIKLKLQEQEFETLNSKNRLLKKLEGDFDGRNSNLS